MRKIESDIYVVNLIARSSLSRLGLFVQITADSGHLGTKACWTLKLKSTQSLVAYQHMIIGQVYFWKTLGDRKQLHDGKYSRDADPQSSKLYEELEL